MHFASKAHAPFHNTLTAVSRISRHFGMRYTQQKALDFLLNTYLEGAAAARYSMSARFLAA